MNLGYQTEEFLSRLEAYGEKIPQPLNLMASMMGEMIREIESPTAADIRTLYGKLREIVGTENDLSGACGSEGVWCAQCPFGAYLPPGVAHASPEAPYCLPWAALRSGG